MFIIKNFLTLLVNRDHSSRKQEEIIKLITNIRHSQQFKNIENFIHIQDPNIFSYKSLNYDDNLNKYILNDRYKRVIDIDYEALKENIYEMIKSSVIATNCTSFKDSPNNAQFTCLYLMFYQIIARKPKSLEELNNFINKSSGIYSLRELIKEKISLDSNINENKNDL